MEARSVRLALCMACLVCAFATSSLRGQYPGRFAAHSPNFIVFAQSDQMARAVATAAEKQRSELALHWLGHELPAWSTRCPIHVTAGPRLGAGGETRFSLMSGEAGNWTMRIQGTPERILDSVLPHELTHTILATHFAPLDKHVPRWADEGACTTVEHSSEKKKHNDHLEHFLRTGQGISFNRLFSLKDYPPDILPLYAQSHSVVQFLIDQGGPRKFVAFIEDGLRSDDWEGAVRRAYLYETLGYLKQEWNHWVADGRPAVTKYSPLLRQTSLAQGKGMLPQPKPPAAPVLLASATTPITSYPSDEVARVGNESWYRQQLLRGAGQSSRSAPTGSTGLLRRTATMDDRSSDLTTTPGEPIQVLPPATAQASEFIPISSQQSNVAPWNQVQPSIAEVPTMVPLRVVVPAVPNSIWR